jgi:amidase
MRGTFLAWWAVFLYKDTTTSKQGHLNLTIFTDYAEHDALGLADLVRRGEVHPIELVEAAIDRIETLNPVLNAVIEPTYERARTAANGPLGGGPFTGVPFLLKDLMAPQAGVPMTAGSRLLRDFVPDHDSEIVERYRAAGLIILGRTNTPEFGLLPTTEPKLFGPTRNPWDLTRTPGGSSGGSAAAVAARLVPVAHGNDGAGSIRIPAACCGLFGLKPTRGRTPMGPDALDAWQGLAAHHVLSRSVRDSAAMLDATAGPEPGGIYRLDAPPRPFLQEVGADPGRLRIAFSSKPTMGTVVDDVCLEALAAAVKLCQDLGHDLVEADPPLDGQALASAMMTMVGGEVHADLHAAAALTGRKPSREDVEAITWAAYLLGRETSAGVFAAAVRELHETGHKIAPFFEHYDLLITPTLAALPPLLGELRPRPLENAALRLLGALNAGGLLRAVVDPDEVAQYLFDFIPFTPLANATGCPAMSIPLYWTDGGLPIGIHFMAPFGDEATLFRLAAQLEETKPWGDRMPPLSGATRGRESPNAHQSDTART